MNSLVAGRRIQRAQQRAIRPHLITALLLAAATIQGCAGGEEPIGAVVQPAVNDAGFDAASTLPPPVGSQPPVGQTTPDTGVGIAPPAKDAGAASAVTGLPCNLQKIIAEKCTKCHSDPVQAGAPIPLTKQAFWQQPGNSNKAKKYFELAQVRVNSEASPMPPRTEPQLTADEKTALNAWLNQGAPASTDSCAPIVVPDAGMMDDPTKVDTTGLDCYKFLAHAEGDKNAKFKVGAVVDKYLFFGFKAPWTSTVYGKVVKPVTDNTKALHHWLLYKENVADGSIEETIGQHQGGELIDGWAPGGIAMDFRKHGDVSFELPAATYGLELHYNSSDAAAQDASGAEICVSKTATKNLATMTWLGYDQGGALSYASGSALCFEAATSWTGTCKPV